MIRHFRRRFIIISMALVAAVSLIAFSIIGVLGYQQVKGVMDDALHAALETSPEDVFTLPSVGFAQGGHDAGRDAGIPVYVVSVLYSNPAKIVISQSSTGVMDEDISNIVVAKALDQIGQGKFAGLVSGYDLYYQATQIEVGYRIAFADAAYVADDFGQRVAILVVTWVLLMLALFVVTVFLSRYVARPVEQAMKDQQRFVADASHELKTPLTVILANVSILKGSPEKTVAEQDTWVEGISAEATRMQQLTEDLLTLAQTDAGAVQAQLLSTVDFSSLVEGQVLQFDAVAFERGLAIEQDVEEGIVVTGDAMRLEGMVKTLLENACKYAERPGTIAVALKRSRSSAVLTVANHGDTIPPEDLAHLFDRFFKSDKARANDGEAASFGLGLSIAKSTVEAHKGTIEAASEDGLTTFTVKLPVAK